MRLPGFALAIASLATVAFTSPAMTQTRYAPLRIIYPFAGGGSGDALARLIADRLSIALERPVIVEPRAGAAGDWACRPSRHPSRTGIRCWSRRSRRWPCIRASIRRSTTIRSRISRQSLRSQDSISASASIRNSRQEPRRARRMAEGKSGKGQFRHAGRRHPPPFLRSHVRESHRGAAATHRLQGRHASR